MKCEIKSWGWETGSANVTLELEVQRSEPVLQFMQEMQFDRHYTVEIKEQRRVRSLSANALMWSLLGDMCKILKRTDPQITPNDLYRNYISETSNYIIGEYWESELPKLQRIWNSYGIGWFFLKTDVVEDVGEPKWLVRQYYGSSQYDSKQMAQLIDSIMADAKELGIDTTNESFKALIEQYPGGQYG